MGRSKTLLGILVLFLALAIPPVTATEIFFEGFESGSLDTNNWTNTGTGKNWTAQDGGKYEGNYGIKVSKTIAQSILEISLNTFGFEDIVFSFYYRVSTFEIGEYLAAEWYNGSEWITIFNVTTGNGWLFDSTNLSADNNSDFKIRFICLNDHNSESCAVDNVTIGTIDAIPPASVTSLVNLSATISSIYWNWTNPGDSDFDVNVIYLDSVWKVNTSDNFYNATGLNGSTSYTITVHTKDTSWNVNNTDVNDSAMTSDVIVPNITNLTEGPSDPVTYSSGAIYEFNATVVDNMAVDTVLIEFNGINYTVLNASASVYNFTISDLAVGTYNYKWFANDTSNNWNTTASYSFTINKTYANVSLLLNGTSANITISEGEIVNITGLLVSGQSSIELYNNGASINTGTSPLINFTTFSTAGTYNLTVMYAETENYTANSETHYVLVQSSPSSLSSSGSSNNNNNDNRGNTGVRKNPGAYTPPSSIAKPKLFLRTTPPQRNPAPEISKNINAITGLIISDQDELPKSRFFLPLLSMFFLSLLTIIGIHYGGKFSRNHQHKQHMLQQLKKAHRK